MEVRETLSEEERPPEREGACSIESGGHRWHRERWKIPGRQHGKCQGPGGRTEPKEVLRRESELESESEKGGH